MNKLSMTSIFFVFILTVSNVLVNSFYEANHQPSGLNAFTKAQQNKKSSSNRKKVKKKSKYRRSGEPIKFSLPETATPKAKYDMSLNRGLLLGNPGAMMRGKDHLHASQASRPKVGIARVDKTNYLMFNLPTGRDKEDSETSEYHPERNRLRASHQLEKRFKKREEQNQRNNKGSLNI